MSSNPAEVNRFVILAAVDASEAAHEVLREAARFARGIPGSELHLVHVVEDLPAPVTLVPVPVGLGCSAVEIEAAARRCLEDLAAEAGPQLGGDVVTHLQAGHAWKRILEVAASVQADLVVLGTHGRGGVKRWILGSVAECVVRRASCPVLVAREKDYDASMRVASTA